MTADQHTRPSGSVDAPIAASPAFDDHARPRPAIPAQIPGWVPAVIDRYVTDSFRPRSPVLVRLLTEPRMKAIWAQFNRRHRLTGQYLHPARVFLKHHGEASHRQDFALLMLFSLVVDVGERPPRTMLQREFTAKQEEWNAMARKMWAEADMLADKEEVGASAPGGAKTLSAAADVLFRMSLEPPAGKVIVERDRGERDVQAVAMIIAGACTWLFGSSLYAVTAALTSVALDRPVTARKVRQWGPAWSSADKGSFLGLLSAGFKF